MNNEQNTNTPQSQQLNIAGVTYRYYNSGDILGIIGVPIYNIKHQDGEYTFLVGREPKYQWIRTIDLFNTREEAENQLPALFYNGR